jgi:hypothetical protein
MNYGILQYKSAYGMRKNYVSPLIEVMEVEVEAGFAATTTFSADGNSNDFTTNNFGTAGGNTMDF